MSGKLSTPGTITIEWLDRQDEPSTFDVDHGPWVYVDWLCWRPSSDPNLTKYAPLRNIEAWHKVESNPSIINPTA